MPGEPPAIHGFDPVCYDLPLPLKRRSG